MTIKATLTISGRSVSGTAELSNETGFVIFTSDDGNFKAHVRRELCNFNFEEQQ